MKPNIAQFGCRTFGFELDKTFLEIDHRYTPINTDNTDGAFMDGWVVIGLLTISHDLLAPLLINIRRNTSALGALSVVR
ncbi:hypothetical protein [Fischerella sp. NIES-3754]|uniref:hypothetical protein n=1 Tax=Fischerella sp. NIES-3754 TaxID=1752063 RepID=UPI000720DA8C|nr:hypothetical protein [Fischerella sp. NIES-3754]BAU05621.1 hypothetical protein FIS3754_15270 [Fischerella sp. NIES-3754]BCX07889.1 MAG: hypothetical protein KatS3mg066_1748 [Fischerella sp.]